MTISGQIKFFERSSALYKDGTTATASTGSGANNILTNNQRVYWQSSGSDDTTTETITVTYDQTVTIDRIALNRINWKEFTVQYDASGVATDFTNATGLDGATASGNISETDFSDEVAYYEVDSITTSEIIITATKTQTADQEKILYNLFTTVELGTLEYPPQITPLPFTRNPRQAQGMGGLAVIQKGFETVAFSLDFTSHPSQSDMNLLTTLHDRDKSFLVWLWGSKKMEASKQVHQY